jgi:hypothetical protein
VENPFLRWIPPLWAGNSRQNHYLSRGRGVLTVRRQNSSVGFLVYELVIPGRITIYPVEADGNMSRIPYYKGSLLPKKIFFKFKLENVIKMKINFIWPYYELHICPKKSKKVYQNLVRLSLLNTVSYSRRALWLDCFYCFIFTRKRKFNEHQPVTKS